MILNLGKPSEVIHSLTLVYCFQLNDSLLSIVDLNDYSERKEINTRNKFLFIN